MNLRTLYEEEIKGTRRSRVWVYIPDRPGSDVGDATIYEFSDGTFLVWQNNWVLIKNGVALAGRTLIGHTNRVLMQYIDNRDVNGPWVYKPEDVDIANIALEELYDEGLYTWRRVAVAWDKGQPGAPGLLHTFPRR